MIRRVQAHSATRFAIVGVANFLVSFAVFYAALRVLPALFGAPAGAKYGSAATPVGAAANVLAYLAGMVNSFLFNRNWTFRASGGAAGDTRTQAARFAVVNLFCLAFSTGIIYVLVDVMRYHEFAVWFPMTVLTVVMSYLGCRYWAFAPVGLATPRRLTT